MWAGSYSAAFTWCGTPHKRLELQRKNTEPPSPGGQLGDTPTHTMQRIAIDRQPANFRSRGIRNLRRPARRWADLIIGRLCTERWTEDAAADEFFLVSEAIDQNGL
jgi:hypothetical protein